MATIFYHDDQGTPSARPIYGVHPDNDIQVPERVLFFDVPEAPQDIPWPLISGFAKGREQWSAIDTVSGQIVVLPAVIDDPPPQPRLTAEELADILIDSPARPITRADVDAKKAARGP